MVGILVVAHGQQASALLEAAEMMFGPQEKTAAVSLLPSDSADCFQERVVKAMAALGAEQTLILADLFGGTPANAAARQVKNGRCHLIAGVNLPMLLEVLGARNDGSLENLTELASNAGRSAVTTLTGI